MMRKMHVEGSPVPPMSRAGNCIECGGELQRHTRIDGSVSSIYVTCKECRYTCSEDHVLGYWYGRACAIQEMKDG